MKRKPITEEFLKAIPKTDLHTHLDGSLRLSTLIELSKAHNIELPSYEEEGLKELVFKEHYQSLEDYLHGFKYTCAVMQSAESLERIAYEHAIDAFKDGVRYVEPRFAPQLHTSKTLSMEEVMESVNRGLEMAKKEINSAPEIKNGDEPAFAYGIIGCAMRMFNDKFSKYYRNFVHLHKFSGDSEKFGMASLELAKALVSIRDSMGIPIVGFDLAGAEAGYPAEDHKDAFEYAHRTFMKKTVHAGEAYGAASIFQAITDLHADRIGHGTYLFDTSKVDLPTKKDREEYINALAQYIADRRITIEICLTSNMQTNPSFRHLIKHPCKQMLDNRLSVTFCTDNRLISRTSSSKEFALAVKHFELDPRMLKHIVIYGFKRSFYPSKYIEKRKYVRKIIDYYEKVEKDFGIQPSEGSVS